MRSIRNSRGMSVIEILIVATLASLVLLAGTLIMSRTTRSFKKGTDMLNTQVLMDAIVERLRSDVRSLKSISSLSDTALAFISLEGGTETAIRYEYDPDTKTLTRQRGTEKTDFHGARQVESFLFQALPSAGDFQYLNVAMQLKSDMKGEGAGSRLSIVCQFHSKCVEPSFTFGR
ncbi:MAG TPA: hypothetical protein VIV61_05535 [Candidatus Ozemobacteraceae bacterium]